MVSPGPGRSERKADDPEDRQPAGSPPSTYWGVALLVLVAAALRYHGCFSFPFFGDEAFTLSHSREVRLFFTTWEPSVLAAHRQGLVTWALNAILLDVFRDPVHAIRAFPLFFGVAFFPAAYWLVARRLGATALVVALTLLAVNPTHVLFSQLGRFYAAVFFFANLALLTFFLSLERRSWRLFLGSQVLFLLSFFSHPGAGLLLTAEAAFLVLILSRSGREVAALLRAKDPFALTVGATFLISSVAVILLSIPILIGWRWVSTVQNHYSTLTFLAGTIVGVGLPLTVFASLASIHFLLRRDPAGVFLSLALFCPILAGVGLSWMGMSVAPRYVAYVIFPACLLAGYFLVSLLPRSQVKAERRPYQGSSGLLLGACTLALASGSLPELISHYIDGSRPDAQAAAAWIEQQREGRGAIVVGDTYVRYYLTGAPPPDFLEEPQLGEVVRSVEQGDLTIVRHAWWASLSREERAALAAFPHWVVWGADREGLSPGEPHRAILTEEYELEARIGKMRLDHRRNYLLIFGPRRRGEVGVASISSKTSGPATSGSIRRSAVLPSGVCSFCPHSLSPYSHPYGSTATTPERPPDCSMGLDLAWAPRRSVPGVGKGVGRQPVLQEVLGESPCAAGGHDGHGVRLVAHHHPGPLEGRPRLCGRGGGDDGRAEREGGSEA
jgi:hypothetical protein